MGPRRIYINFKYFEQAIDIQVEIIVSRMKPSSFSSCPYPSLCPYLSELSLHPLQSLVGEHMYRLACTPSLDKQFINSAFDYTLQVITELFVTPKVLPFPQWFIPSTPALVSCIPHSSHLHSASAYSMLFFWFIFTCSFIELLNLNLVLACCKLRFLM